MGSTLTNGIYLPAEGERNCYTGLAANWSALDSLIGGYNAHIGNTTIHVTAEDKQAWNGKADASALTAHTGDTSIHVTAADKQAWNGHVADSVKHVTAEDKAKWDAVTSKADDSDVVHKSGDETISGNKTWSGVNTFQQNITYQRTNFFHQAVSPCYILKDTELKKGSLASTHTAYPGLWQDKNNNILGYVRFVEYSSGRQTAEFRLSNLIKNGTLDPTGSEVNCTALLELQPSGEKSLIPEQNNAINLGTSTNKWNTLNGLEPSSLSLPSGNANNVIDISSYITALDGTSNNYTVPANGWISIAVVGTAIAIVSSSWSDSRFRSGSGNVRMLYPVLKNETLAISVTGTTLTYARFIPCQGNV